MYIAFESWKLCVSPHFNDEETKTQSHTEKIYNNVPDSWFHYYDCYTMKATNNSNCEKLKVIGQNHVSLLKSRIN